MIKNLVFKLIGKKLGDNISVSKAKLSAIIYVVIIGIQEISKAYGHAIEIPPSVFRILEAAGLWAVRDAIK
jgi:hypothetical protein